MGAIFGLILRDGQEVDEAVLMPMAASLAHRGVVQMVRRGPCGLGMHTLFAASEVGAEEAVNERYLMVCDARLDNVENLATALNLPTTAGEQTLLREAYQAWGPACVDHLLGDFAFTVYDAQEDLLFCVRDHFGIKPFYYALTDQAFLFASEPKALLASGLVPRTLDDAKIADFTLASFHDTERTFYQSIHRLQPAHTLTMCNSRVEKRRYWRLEIPQPATAHPPPTDREYADRFRELFVEAVRCRLRGGPVGTFLSGGLDSSAVTMVARMLLAQADAASPLPVFSAVFPDVPASDERRFIDVVLAQGGLDPHFFRADQVGSLENQEEVLKILDDPGGVPNLYHTWGLLALARAVGVRVMLTGLDGDTVVSHGFASLTELALAERWQELGDRLGQAAKQLGAYGNVQNALIREYVEPVLAEWARHYRLPRMLRLMNALHRLFGLSRRQMIEKTMLPALMRRSGKDQAGFAEIAPAFRQSGVFRERLAILRRQAVFPHSAVEDHLRGLESGLLTAGFEAIDKVSAAYGVECRHPFFDKRLVEYCLSLPIDQKMRQGWTRYVLRTAMAGILPEDIQWRPDKSNLGHNFARSLQFHRALVEDVLRAAPPAFAGVWDVDRLKTTWGRYLDKPTEKDALTLFMAMQYATWVQSMDGGSTTDSGAGG